MVNLSKRAQRQATSSTKLDDAFSLASTTKSLQRSLSRALLDVLLLIKSSVNLIANYAGNRSPGKDRRRDQAFLQGETDFQPLSLD